MAMGAEPSVPMAQSTVQTTTSPARASTPDFAERIFSLMVLPAIVCRIARRPARRRVAGQPCSGIGPLVECAVGRRKRLPHFDPYYFVTIYEKSNCMRISESLYAAGSGGNGLAALMAAMTVLSNVLSPVV